jgi:hypothetical protein
MTAQAARVSGDSGRIGRAGRHRPHAVEAALDTDLRYRSDIGRAERAALRAQAHAVDLASATGDPELITTANRGYLALREAAALTAGGPEQVDSFAALVAELATPGTGP